MLNDAKIARLENLAHRDPTSRGLASFLRDGQFLDAGQLASAAASLARATSVGLVTGFAVVVGENVAAETDGPPGALLLSYVLLRLGIDVTLISDRYGVPLLRAGAPIWDLPASIIRESDGSQTTADSAPNKPCSHLVAIERVGPSHTLESLVRQPRPGAPPSDAFEREVPPQDRDVRHNMRGAPVDAWTPPLDRLFDFAADQPRPVTIGLADGGNEIGVGQLPWETVREAVRSPVAGRIACRIPTDYLLLAGVSDWAAYALAGAVCLERGRPDLLDAETVTRQRALLEALVRAGALDGITRTPSPTVDGLPTNQYLDVLAEIVRTVTRAR